MALGDFQGKDCYPHFTDSEKLIRLMESKWFSQTNSTDMWWRCVFNLGQFIFLSLSFFINKMRVIHFALSEYVFK